MCSCVRHVWRGNLGFLEVNPFCLWMVEAISIYRVKNFFFNEKLFTVYMSVNILMPENSDESKQKYVKFGYSIPLPTTVIICFQIISSIHDLFDRKFLKVEIAIAVLIQIKDSNDQKICLNNPLL